MWAREGKGNGGARKKRCRGCERRGSVLTVDYIVVSEEIDDG